MSLQATIAKLLLKLPAGMKVKMAGGTPLELGGRVLDPNLQFIAHGAANQPPMSSLEPEIAQAAAIVVQPDDNFEGCADSVRQGEVRPVEVGVHGKPPSTRGAAPYGPHRVTVAPPAGFSYSQSVVNHIIDHLARNHLLVVSAGRRHDASHVA